MPSPYCVRGLRGGGFLIDSVRALFTGDSMAGHVLRYVIAGAFFAAIGLFGAGGTIYTLLDTRAMWCKPRRGVQELLVYLAISFAMLCGIFWVAAFLSLFKQSRYLR